MDCHIPPRHSLHMGKSIIVVFSRSKGMRTNKLNLGPQLMQWDKGIAVAPVMRIVKLLQTLRADRCVGKKGQFPSLHDGRCS